MKVAIVSINEKYSECLAKEARVETTPYKRGLRKKEEKKKRGTSLATSRLLFRFAIPAEPHPTDSETQTKTASNIASDKSLLVLAP